MTKPGKLYLLPCPLGNGATDATNWTDRVVLSTGNNMNWMTVLIMKALQHVILEHASADEHLGPAR